MTAQEAIALVAGREELFVAFSRATNMPYVEENPEDASDQVFLFSTREEIQSFGLAKQEEKVPIFAMWHEKKTFPYLFVMFRSIGVDTMVFTHDGTADRIPVAFFVREAADKGAAKALTNPQLQLCSLYFFQAVRTEKRQEQAALVRSFEEEVLANLRRAEFLMLMNPEKGEEGAPVKIHVALLKRKDGKVLMPLFSDTLELNKYTKGKPARTVKVSFGQLHSLLIDQAEGFVVNPMGFNLTLNRETLQKIIGKA